MATRDEVVSPLPTPAVILQWIAAAGGQPWFPSRHAATTGINRDALDEPLSQLRLAELIRVATWIRGVGQGYVLTPEGEAAAAKGTGVPDKPPPDATAATKEPPKPREEFPEDEEDAEASESADKTQQPTLEEQAVAHFGLDVRRPVLIPTLVFANVFWFVAGGVAVLWNGEGINRYLSMKPPAAILHRFGAVMGGDLLDDEWWRLLGACFVHIGLVHLLANMFALGMMGPLAELLWGRWRLAIIYLISGIAGSCLAMANQPDSLLAGASGAIWGVLGSLLAWVMIYRSQLPPAVVADWVRRLTMIFVLNAAVSLLPGVSWEAHLGGGIAGFLTAGLLNALRYSPQPRRGLALLLVVALPLACVGGLVVAMKQATEWATLRQRIAAVESEKARLTAAHERMVAANAAVEIFNRDLVPRLNQMNPDTVHPLRISLDWQLKRPGEFRNAEVVAELRVKVTELKLAADEASRQLSVPPLGVESLDAHRANAKAFADARSREFGLLLAMLDSPAIPNESALTAWGDARRAADAWERIRQK